MGHPNGTPYARGYEAIGNRCYLYAQTRAREGGMNAPIVVLASGKGGTGKTTLALALAAVWRNDGHPVALVDADPQAGATRAVGITPPGGTTVAPPLTAHGVQVWPGGRGLVDASSTELARRLASAAATAGESGCVVVDSAPALTDTGHGVAFDAATLVLVVARCDAAGLVHAAETVAIADGHGVKAVRVVPTFAGSTTLAREALAWMRGRFGDRVTQTVIPSDIRAAEAPGHGRPVIDTAPRSRMAKATRDLAAELAPVLFSAEVTT